MRNLESLRWKQIFLKSDFFVRAFFSKFERTWRRVGVGSAVRVAALGTTKRVSPCDLLGDRICVCFSFFFFCCSFSLQFSQASAKADASVVVLESVINSATTCVNEPLVVVACSAWRSGGGRWRLLSVDGSLW